MSDWFQSGIFFVSIFQNKLNKIISIMQKGNIGVTTENIFPVIKKFLYSDHEIFLREIVSNAVDATQKLNTLASSGELKSEVGNTNIEIKLDKDKKTLTVSDKGIGMTEEEINKYINQIAFSGANDFLEKYKNDAKTIIGHFGLGFYSAFMVASKVEIYTKSYKEGSEAVKWSCDGSPSFSMEKCDKADRGTDIILYIDDDCKEFLEKTKVEELLTKYCKFLPVPIVFGKKQEWKDGKYVDTENENIINDINPLWNRKPADLKDEDYKKFYKDLYPMQEDPLFWIHLNVDYPFHLTGILYFPKIKSNIDIQRNKIQLYCNQVFVTDQVEGIVPEFLTLLHGVIDSPDIPLNVSRSYLQSDSNVKKISGYITKKVADRLQSIFNENRKEFETKWDDLKIFINFGMLTQDDFYDKATKFALLKDTDDKYYTFDEYKTLIKDNQTDKDKTLVYLYANNKDEQYSYIESAKNKGYNVLILNGQLDTAVINQLEQKNEKTKFTRVDSDIIDNLIVKDDVKKDALPKEQSDALSSAFKSQMPKLDKTEFSIMTQPLGETSLPVLITQSEYMRRMKDMANVNAGMSFYGDMPSMYNVVLNTDHPIIKNVLDAEEGACNEQIKPIEVELQELNKKHKDLQDSQKDKKPEDIPQIEKDQLTDLDKKISETREKKESVWKDFAGNNEIVHQLIDLALLQNNMLKGESLTNFVKRSIDLIK
jgi:molecular chaperone HtpG